MLNITACIITNNNHEVLKAIESVYDSVSEIILVNTCEEFTIDLTEYDKVKLYSFDWCDDFAKARNFSISKATGDWILIIDSDDILQGKIKYIDERFTHWLFPVINNGNNISYTERLFKNNGVIKFKNKAHERLAGVSEENECVVTDLVIIHNGYDDEETSKKKIERNLRILETDYENDLRDYYLTNLYFQVDRLPEAVKCAVNVLNSDVNECYKISVAVTIAYILDLKNSIHNVNEIQNKIKEIENVSSAAVYC